MDDELLRGTLIVLGFFGLVAIILVGILPTWFVIQNNWISFVIWFDICILISRILYCIAIPLIFLTFFVKFNTAYASAFIEAIILAGWGVPVYKKSVLALAFTPLTGIELQRTLLTVIFIYGLTISFVLAGKSGHKNGKD